jgi:hypothetical protein
LHWSLQSDGLRSERSGYEEWTAEATHTVAASYRAEQQQDCDFFQKTLWLGNANIIAVAIRATLESYSEHSFTQAERQNQRCDRH